MPPIAKALLGLVLFFGRLQAQTPYETLCDSPPSQPEELELGITVKYQCGRGFPQAEWAGDSSHAGTPRECALECSQWSPEGRCGWLKGGCYRYNAGAISTARLGGVAIYIEKTPSPVPDCSAIQDECDRDSKTQQGTITKLQGDLNTERGTITKLQGDLITERGTITKLQGDLITERGTITKLQGDLKTQKETTTTLQREKKDCESLLSSKSTNIATLEGEQRRLQGLLDSVATQISPGAKLCPQGFADRWGSKSPTPLERKFSQEIDQELAAADDKCIFVIDQKIFKFFHQKANSVTWSSGGRESNYRKCAAVCAKEPKCMGFYIDDYRGCNYDNTAIRKPEPTNKSHYNTFLRL
ncbi:hypothetical protein DM02DRAFT_657567 [Periconia macrospinosa]|uniref:Apple domain-containing protein n=1 Tax=Periconia macrospinosa TaxID=97972 RepID=A0A2V1DJR8_9PLEO|nr:hypothetical protein DM02DRAFT_657567 [Periconia macrospinosa]